MQLIVIVIKKEIKLKRIYTVEQDKSGAASNLCGCSSPVTQDRFDMRYVHVWDINICFEIAMTKRIPPKSNSWLRPWL